MEDLREALGPIFVAIGFAAVCAAFLIVLAHGVWLLFTQPQAIDLTACILCMCGGALMLAGCAVMPKDG